MSHIEKDGSVNIVPKRTNKNSHFICKVKQKEFQNKFIQSFLNKHDPITFITKDIKRNI